MLPGPASSQVGYLVGLHRAGWRGALAAWLGFTLPSALVMFGFARLSPHLGGPISTAVLHGLALTAVAVVAQAVWSMGGRLCPDRAQTAMALIAAAMVIVVGGPGAQFVALIFGAVGGAVVCRGVGARPATLVLPVKTTVGLFALGLFLSLLIVLPLFARGGGHSILAMAAVFYRSGALVFGGGHVVLPLLREALVPAGWLNDGRFLAGYGSAQAMPGPLFTFAAYLGAIIAPGTTTLDAALWSAVALASLFLPGLLIAMAGAPLWNGLRRRPAAQGALAGVNAAVVGILGAALYNPIWTTAVFNGRDVLIAATGFLLLERWRAPPILVVGFCVVAATALAPLYFR